MKKHFVGLLYGLKVYVQADSPEMASIIFKQVKSYEKPRRNFWQRLKYLITNK